jgi:hypothetical protein
MKNILLNRLNTSNEVLLKAFQLNTQIQKLHEEIDALIDPIAAEAIKQNISQEECKFLLELLPTSFARSELRAWMFTIYGIPGNKS